jgi:hypothetical protein
MKREVPSGLRTEFLHCRISPDDAEAAENLPPHSRKRAVVRCAATKSIFDILGEKVSHRGGVTVCNLYSGSERIGKGVAVCSPLDNFNKRIGRDISLGRALKNLETLKAIQGLKRILELPS